MVKPQPFYKPALYRGSVRDFAFLACFPEIRGSALLSRPRAPAHSSGAPPLRISEPGGAPRRLRPASVACER